MPFKSQAQMRFMFATHPKKAKEFAAKAPAAPKQLLPEKVPSNPLDSYLEGRKKKVTI
jgi:hypothetical protein